MMTSSRIIRDLEQRLADLEAKIDVLVIDYDNRTPPHANILQILPTHKPYCHKTKRRPDRARPVPPEYNDVFDALRLLVEAVGCLHQPFSSTGLVSPKNPGGQATATRLDGSKVNRHEFMQTAMANANRALGRRNNG